MVLVRNMNVNRPIGKVTLALKRALIHQTTAHLASSGSAPDRADTMPTRRATTAEHGREPASTGSARNLGPCSTIGSARTWPVTPDWCFLNLVSEVRFLPGAPQTACMRRCQFPAFGRTPADSARLPTFRRRDAGSRRRMVRHEAAGPASPLFIRAAIPYGRIRWCGLLRRSAAGVMPAGGC